MPTVRLEAAVIGTRDPSDSQREAAKEMAQGLSSLGIYINTGAALGIDLAAMRGTKQGFLNVFLPWPEYNLSIIPAHAKVTVYDQNIHQKWTDSVIWIHPASHQLSRGAFALHARNYGIVETARLVIAFPNKTGTGGTGQGIRVADSLGIPVLQYNKGAYMPAISEMIGRAVGMFGQGMRLPIDSNAVSNL